MDALTTLFVGLLRSSRFGEGSALGRAQIIIYNFLKEAGAFQRKATGQYSLDFDAMEQALSDLTALVLKTQATGDADFAAAFEAQYAQSSEDFAANRRALGLEQIPVDIRFNFKR